MTTPEDIKTEKELEGVNLIGPKKSTPKKPDWDTGDPKGSMQKTNKNAEYFATHKGQQEFANLPRAKKSVFRDKPSPEKEQEKNENTLINTTCEQQLKYNN